MKYISQKHGFTLLEILLAIVIFVIVIGSVYSTYKITFDTIHSAENKLTHAIIANNAFDCITEDLNNISVAAATDFTARTTNNDQRPGIEFSFVTTHRIVIQPEDEVPGTFLVTYKTVYDDKSGLLQLYRNSSPATIEPEENISPSSQGWLIADQLKGVQLLYLDDDGNEQEQWPIKDDETQTDTPVLPRMIRIQFEFSPPETNAAGETFRTAVPLTRGKST